jgi:hypothetical protein
VEIGLDNVRKARRLSRLEVEDCARVIAVLASRDSRVPLSELSHEAGLTNLPEVCRQLRDFAGVVFLRFEPGLSLTSDLRNELFRELGIRPDRGTPPLPWNAFASGAIPHELPEGVRLGAQSTSAGSTPRLDPLPLRRAEEKGPQRRRFGDLLASTGGEDKVEGASNPINQRATASREEFEAAYRRWLQQSPGRPGAPDATGVSEAQRRIVLVNAAYEAFLSKHTKQREEGVQHEVEGVWEQFKGPSSAASGKAGRTK